MGRGVDILIAISEKHLHYSLFVKRIIAIEAQLYFLGLVGLCLQCLHFTTAIVLSKTGRFQNNSGPVHMIPGQLIAPGQLTDRGVNFSSVHGLTPVGATSRGGLPVVQHRVTRRGNVAPGQQIIM